jgi:hypothetical protein
MNILKEYRNIEESTETLFSILIYDKKVCDVIKYFEDQLDKAKNISNITKKHKVNNRLFNFIKYLNEQYADENIIINNIFLIHEKLIKYDLTSNEIVTAKTYNMFNIFLKVNTSFYIDYFIDFFYNFDFIYTIKINKSDMSTIKMNKTKEKELECKKITNEQKLIDEIEIIRKTHNYKDYIIIYGNSSYLNKINNIKEVVIHNDFLNKEEVYTLYENENMKKKHILLEKKLNELKNEKCNTDLYVFGKLKIEIKTAIETYMLKELYIEDKKYDKLKTFIDETYLNFNVITIKSIENGDIGDMFIKDYNGIMGIKYF